MRWICIIACMVCMCVLSCSKDSGTNDPGDTGATGEWKLDSITSIPVSASPGATLQDSTTGLKFVFPDGGSGTLETAEIVSSVSAPVPGKGYYINYSQSREINLVFAPKSTEQVLVYGYGTSSAVMSDYTNRYNTWVSIAPTVLPDGTLSFELLMPVAVQAGRMSGISAKGYEGFKHYWVGLISQDMPEFDKLNAYRGEARAMIGQYIDAFPESRKAGVRADVDGDMKWYLSFGDDAYNAFWAYGYVASVNRYNITINKNYTNSKDIASHIAHETGHYMYHVLNGNSTYLTAYSQMPYNTKNHGLSEVNDRKSMFIEEPAYFSQYFQTGTVGALDPTEPRGLLITTLPSKYDAPSVEGFGCVMLAALHRTAGTIADVYVEKNPSKRTVPVVNAPFSDIFTILAQKPTNIDMLRGQIETYMMTSGKGDLFQPLMQSIGWGYMATGKLVDKDGIAIMGATVRSVHKSSSREWIGSVSTAASDGYGSFSLPSGVFGGASTLRVVKGTDSTEVDISIDWTQATNVVKNLGAITVDFTKESSAWDQLKQTNYVVAGLSVWHQDSYYGGTDKWIGEGVYNLKWNDRSFTASHLDTFFNKYCQISGKVSADGKTVESFSIEVKTVDKTTGAIIEYRKVSATGIPLKKLNTQWPNVSYQLTGDGVQENVTEYDWYWKHSEESTDRLGPVTWNHEKTYLSCLFDLKSSNPYP